MIRVGNQKLGKKVWTWSIPAVETCPGSSEMCRKMCYAMDSYYRMPSVNDRLSRNYQLSQKPIFADWMIGEIFTNKVDLMRIHVSGDFYSAEYAQKWNDIIAESEDTRFWVYTRSWRIPPIEKCLRRLAQRNNLKLWYSIDKQTGWPDHIPQGVRLAYMSVDDSDVPEHKVDLVFRTKRRTVIKKMNGALVCPVENGVSETTCERCKYCWKETATSKGRVPLSLVA